MQIHSARKPDARARDAKYRLDAVSGAVSDGRHPLSMYARAPQGEVTLEEFENFAFDRLEVLRAIQMARANGKSHTDLEANFSRLLNQYSLGSVRKDNISHFILRLAYSRKEETRKSFAAFEEALFRYRFKSSTAAAQSEFFKHNKLNFEQVNPNEVAKLIEENKIHVGFDEDRSRPGRYFKVPFQKVLKLIAWRNVYLQRGIAYIPESKLIEVVVTKFRAHLSRELAVAYRAMQNQRRDRRLEPLLASLSTQYLGPKVKTNVGGTITPADIPALAKQSFPLCMRNSYEHLKADHHLKHGGRMHFSLFLKAIGLGMEDALRFWRTSFEPRTNATKFEKTYAYNLKHNYGKVGNGVSYSPYSCLKIITHIPTGGDHCGCPYKLFPDVGLQAKLRKIGISEKGVREIAAKAKNGDFQPACSLQFHYSHAGSDKDDIVVLHPNGYYEQSIEYYKAKEEEKGDSGNTSSQNSSQGSTRGGVLGLPTPTPIVNNGPRNFIPSSTPSVPGLPPTTPQGQRNYGRPQYPMGNTRHPNLNVTPRNATATPRFNRSMHPNQGSTYGPPASAASRTPSSRSATTARTPTNTTAQSTLNASGEDASKENVPPAALIENKDNDAAATPSDSENTKMSDVAEEAGSSGEKPVEAAKSDQNTAGEQSTQMDTSE